MMKATIVLTGMMMVTALSAPALADGSRLPEPEQLRVWLEMTKSDYKLCEDVWMYLFVVNNGSKPVQLPIVDVEDRFALQLDIVHESGKVLRYGGLSQGTEKPSIVVQPGDTVMFPINVSAGHAKGGWMTKYPASVPLGEFTIKAKYLQKYETDKLTFRVLPLNKEEERIIFAYYDVMKSGARGDKGLREYMRVFDQAIDSPFGPQLGRFVFIELPGQGDRQPQRIEYAKKLIDTYPDNACVYGPFCYLVWLLPDQQLKSILTPRKAILQHKYTRFMFRLAANRYNKSYLIKEVEQ